MKLDGFPDELPHLCFGLSVGHAPGQVGDHAREEGTRRDFTEEPRERRGGDPLPQNGRPSQYQFGSEYLETSAGRRR